jgi:hypothetical protein
MKTKESAQADLELVCRNIGKKLNRKARERIRKRAEKVQRAILDRNGILNIGVGIIREMRDA